MGINSPCGIYLSEEKERIFEGENDNIVLQQLHHQRAAKAAAQAILLMIHSFSVAGGHGASNHAPALEELARISAPYSSHRPPGGSQR